MSEVDVEAVGRRVEELLDRVADADPAVAGIAEQLVAELIGLYGAGLRRIIDHLDADVFRRLSEDELVAGLLSLHDLHPQDITERVAAAVAGLAPAVREQGGGEVRLVEADDYHAVIEVATGSGGCGCSGGAPTEMVEAAVRGAVPELEFVEVREKTATATGGLIPLESLAARRPAHDPTLVRPEDVAAGVAVMRQLDSGRVVLCRTNGHVQAFLDACPECSGSLDGGRIDGHDLTCPSCGARIGLADGAAELEAVPVVEDLAGLRLAVTVT